MAHKRQALAKSELEVAQVVWKLGEARVRDVVDALAAADPEKKLDFWTVQTYLRRLKAKGYLRTRREGRADVYLPAVRPTRVLRDLVNDFVNRRKRRQLFARGTTGGLTQIRNRTPRKI